jgi:hypothetical protein
MGKWTNAFFKRHEDEDQIGRRKKITTKSLGVNEKGVVR